MASEVAFGDRYAAACRAVGVGASSPSKMHPCVVKRVLNVVWGIGGALADLGTDEDEYLHVAACVGDVVEAPWLSLEGEGVPAHDRERLDRDGVAALVVVACRRGRGRGILAEVGVEVSSGPSVVKFRSEEYAFRFTFWS